MSLRGAIVVFVQVAAAVAFLGFGWRHHSKFLLWVGALFVAAVLLVAFPSAIGQHTQAYGYALGFAASITGLLGVLRLYILRQTGKSRSDG